MFPGRQSMETDTYFNRTCEVFNLQHCPNGLIMDPCDCSNFYQCGSNQVTRGKCPKGTAFNFMNGICDTVGTVSQQQGCSGNGNPWDRCNVSDTRREQLEDICMNSQQTTKISGRNTTIHPAVTDSASSAGTSSTSSAGTSLSSAGINSTPSAGINSASSAGINPGIVVGAIIAGSVFTAIIFVAIVMYRRTHKSELPTSTSTPSNDPEYHEAENPEDRYAVIHDTHIVNNPTYTETQNTHGPTTSNGNHHRYGALSGNFGAREVNVYHTLNLSSDGYEIPRTSVADSSTRTSDLYSKPHKKLGNPDTEGNIGFALGVDSPPVRKEMSDDSGGNHETHPVYFEPQPDYFVLEKVDHFCDQNQ